MPRRNGQHNIFQTAVRAEGREDRIAADDAPMYCSPTLRHFCLAAYKSVVITHESAWALVSITGPIPPVNVLSPLM